jgi:molybdate transport system substrate-binding protein
MKKKIALFLLCVFLLTAPVQVYASTEIIVSAAISLRNAFEEIGRMYEQKNRGAQVVFNFASSGGLMRQIEAGAPADVFASASQKEMDELEQKGLIVPGSRTIFAANTPVLIAPRKAREKIRDFPDLATSGVKRIAAGNPMTVPAGRYAEQVFHYYNLFDRIRDKLIFAENVRQVLDYVARGEVDAGVVYKTDALSRPAEVRIVAEAPGAAHRPTLYPIAVVKGSGSEGAAKAFISLVASAEGKKILEKYGFKAVNE